MEHTHSMVQKWLKTARWAASGGNAQPWSVAFEERDSSIAIQLSIDSAYFPKHSPLDVRGAAAVIALGCLATNLIALASMDGFRLTLKTFKLGQDYWKSSVLLIFEKGGNGELTYTLEEILNRHTNRYPFSKEGVSGEFKTAISKVAQRHSTLTLQEYAENKVLLTRELKKLEEVRWYSTSYFQSFLSEVGFDLNFESEPDKIPVSQLGLPESDQRTFKLFRRWPVLHKFLKSIIQRVVSEKALENYTKHCDRIYLFQANANDFAHAFDLGRAFQEAWLEAERYGLGFQPLGIPLVALGFWEREPGLGLKPFQERKIQEATANIQKQFSVDLHFLTLGFRVGYPTEKIGRSPRKALVGRPIEGLVGPIHSASDALH